MKSLQQHINEKLIINKHHNNDKIFIYELDYEDNIRIISDWWPQFNDYKNNVYINNEHIELDGLGKTIKKYNSGTYEVTIKNLYNITTCEYMFGVCKHLVKVPWFDTSNVKSMEKMFWGCEQLKEVPEFNTYNVNSMKEMFEGCWNIENVPNFDTRNVEDMFWMFYNCPKLKNVPNFNMNKLNNVHYMFSGCYKLNEQTKKYWSKIYNFKTNCQI